MGQELKHEDLVFIQNTFWGMYKEYAENHNAKEYTRKARELAAKYSGNKTLKSFCENLAITWTPVISGLGDAYRRGLEEG